MSSERVPVTCGWHHPWGCVHLGKAQRRKPMNLKAFASCSQLGCCKGVLQGTWSVHFYFSATGYSLRKGSFTAPTFLKFCCLDHLSLCAKGSGQLMQGEVKLLCYISSTDLGHFPLITCCRITLLDESVTLLGKRIQPHISLCVVSDFLHHTWFTMLLHYYSLACLNPVYCSHSSFSLGVSLRA